MIISKRHIGWFSTVFVSVVVMLTMVLVKLIYQEETKLFKLFFYRAICFVIFTSILILFNKFRLEEYSPTKYLLNPYIYIFAFTHTSELSCAYYVLSYTTIGNHASFGSSGIILAIPLATLFLNQPMKWVYLPCVILTVVGTAILIQPEFLFGGDTGGYSVLEILGIIAWVLLFAGLFISYGFVKGIPYDILLFYDAIFCMLAYGMVCFSLGHHDLPSAKLFGLIAAWAILVIIGLCLEMLGTQLIPMGEVSTIRSFDKVWGYFFGFIFLGEELTTASVVGSILILVAIVLIVRSKDEESHNSAISTPESENEMELSQIDFEECHTVTHI